LPLDLVAARSLNRIAPLNQRVQETDTRERLDSDALTRRAPARPSASATADGLSERRAIGIAGIEVGA